MHECGFGKFTGFEYLRIFVPFLFVGDQGCYVMCTSRSEGSLPSFGA